MLFPVLCECKYGCYIRTYTQFLFFVDFCNCHYDKIARFAVIKCGNMKNSKLHACFPVLIFMLFALFSCELNEEVIRRESDTNKINIREASLEKLLRENKFVNAYNAVYANREKSRTVMEGQYSFTIVPHGAKVIEDGNKTSYTFKITREISNPDYFENLVINVDSLGQPSAYILKYTPSEPLSLSAHGSFAFKGQVKITPIVYNASEMDKTTICVTAQILMCDQAWSPDNTGVHVATNECNDQNHLFYSPVTTCYTTNGDIGGGGDGDPGVTVPIGDDGGGSGGGGGDGDPSTGGGLTPPNHCPRCPVFETTPVEEWTEPPLHCDKLKGLLKSAAVKNAIRALNSEQVFGGTKEKGYNLALNPQNKLIATEVPYQSTGESSVRYSQSAMLFGGIHCHLRSHAPMFSHDDVAILSGFYTRHNFIGNNGVADPTIPVHIVVTNQGIYAISADDHVSIQKLLDIYSNKDSRKKFINDIGKRYDKLADENTLLPIGYLQNYQKTFLEFLKENDLNISLYNANDDLTGWTKLSLNNDSNTNTNEPIIKTNCN